MDCLYSVDATPVPYPQYFAYDLIASPEYLGLVAGGYMAKSISTPTGGGGLATTAEPGTLEQELASVTAAIVQAARDVDAREVLDAERHLFLFRVASDILQALDAVIFAFVTPVIASACLNAPDAIAGLLRAKAKRDWLP